MEAVLVPGSTIGALGGLCRYSRVLYEHPRGCACTAEYYWSTREDVLVEHSTIRASGRLCWYSRVL